VPNNKKMAEIEELSMSDDGRLATPLEPIPDEKLEELRKEKEKRENPKFVDIFDVPEADEDNDFWFGPYADDENDILGREVKNTSSDMEINQFLESIQIGDSGGDDDDDSDDSCSAYNMSSKIRNHKNNNSTNDNMPSDLMEETVVKIDDIHSRMYEMSNRMELMEVELAEMKKYFKRVNLVVKKLALIESKLDAVIGVNMPKP
jgi:hypothetical protein